jgi:hypothetical protein
MKTTQLSRISHHTISATGSSFSVPTQEDFTVPQGMTGSWTQYDLALSEIGVLEEENRAFIRIGGNINEFSFGGGGGTGSGTSGSSGTSGAAGSSGTSGTSGSAGTSGVSPIVGATQAYSITYHTGTEITGGTAVANYFKFDSSVVNENITWVYSGSAPTQYTILNAGVYDFVLNAAATNATADFVVDIWMSINGVDDPYSRQTFFGSATEIQDFNWKATRNIFDNDVIRFWWWSDDAGTRLLYDGTQSSPDRPERASCDLTITRLALYPKGISDDGTRLAFSANNITVMELDSGSVSVNQPFIFNAGYTQSTAIQFGTTTDTGIYSSTDGYVSFRSNGTTTAEINDNEAYLNVLSGDQIYISQGAGISLFGLQNGTLITGTLSFASSGLNVDEILYTDFTGALRSKEWGNNYTPISGTDSYGYEGQLTYDNDYIYIKSSGLWRRAALASW